VFIAAVGTVAATALRAQTTEPARASEAPQVSRELAALRECVALADAGKGTDAAQSGMVAASLYMKRVEQNPRDAEALVGAARAKSQCLTPSASFMQQGELSAEAMELLERALDVQADHWLARYVLASIAYRSPSFLGRGKRAAKEFDELLRQQGDRIDNPMFARVFAMRGIQLSKAGQADSARALWERGARLFPDDAELQRLARGSHVARDTTVRPPPSTDSSVARVSLDSASSVSSATLEAVQVRATSTPSRAPLPSIKDVTRSQVLLTAGGAADVMQAVQMQPGATRVGEGGDIYTRGGDATETALIVNGGRILSLARFEGLNGSMFGALEPFVVKSVRYSSGGFSARHGNALSGVLEIETDGRPVERSSRAGLSLVQASGTVRAPFNTKVGGWISGRVSHTGALLQTHGRTDEFSGAPQSQELIASLIVAPTPFAELRASAVVEHDDSRRLMSAAGWRGAFQSEGDTRAVMLSARWMSSKVPLIVRSSVTGSSRSNAWAFGILERDRREHSQLARVDAEWQASRLMLRAGVEQGTHTRNDRGVVPSTGSVAEGSPVHVLENLRSAATQVGVYAEAEAAKGRLSVIAGARADRLPGENEVTFDPRLAVSARFGSWTTRLSGGLFHQGRWRGDVAIPDAGTPSGLALTARHLVAGVERETSTSLIRAEAFAKRYSDYRAFGAGPALARIDTRGIDLIAQQMSGAVTGFVGYSLLDATSQLATGERVRGAFDVTHSITASATRVLNANWSVGSTLRYGTGVPRTPIIGGSTRSDGRIEPVYGAIMSDRLPDYARLDARVMRYIRFPNVLLTTYAEILNIGNRGNVTTWTYGPTYTSREPVHTFFAKRTVVIGGELMFR
jgi:tetratricopeptide (TPR) repeat protein